MTVCTTEVRTDDTGVVNVELMLAGGHGISRRSIPPMATGAAEASSPLGCPTKVAGDVVARFRRRGPGYSGTSFCSIERDVDAAVDMPGAPRINTYARSGGHRVAGIATGGTILGVLVMAVCAEISRTGIGIVRFSRLTDICRRRITTMASRAIHCRR